MKHAFRYWEKNPLVANLQTQVQEFFTVWNWPGRRVYVKDFKSSYSSYSMPLFFAAMSSRCNDLFFRSRHTNGTASGGSRGDVLGNLSPNVSDAPSI